MLGTTRSVNKQTHKWLYEYFKVILDNTHHDVVVVSYIQLIASFLTVATDGMFKARSDNMIFLWLIRQNL